MDQNTNKLGRGTYRPTEDSASRPDGSNSPRHWDDDGLQLAPSEYVLDQESGLQVVEGQGKEATLNSGQEKEVVYDQVSQPGLQPYRHAAVESNPTKKKKSISRKWVFAAAIVIVIIVVAIVVAVVETRKRGGSTNSSPGSSPNSTNDGSLSSPNDDVEVSTTGAYRGTGLAVMALPLTPVDRAWLIYQRYTGDLMLVRYSNTGTWQSPEKLAVLDALKGTSIATAAFQLANVTSWYVFYVDTTGILQDLIRTNETNAWNKGTLGNLNHNASTIPGGALFAHFSSVYYSVTRNVGGGIRLFANDGSSGNVVEISYDYASNTWEKGMQFDNSNGRAGVEVSHLWELSTLTLMNRRNKLETWSWSSLQNTTKNDFPRGNWIKGPEAPVSLLNNSSISGFIFGNDSIWYQDQTGNLTGIGHNGNADNYRWESPFGVNGGTKALTPTQIASGAFPPPTNLSAPSELHVYFQTNGTNIWDYTKRSD
ncbi:MAG: hypothetical protein Q9187_006619, partial [Circinaria calcarea]